VHLIPPGAADTVHFHMHIPEMPATKSTPRQTELQKIHVVEHALFLRRRRRSNSAQRRNDPDYDDRKFASTATLVELPAR